MKHSSLAWWMNGRDSSQNESKLQTWDNIKQGIQLIQLAALLLLLPKFTTFMMPELTGKVFRLKLYNIVMARVSSRNGYLNRRLHWRLRTYTLNLTARILILTPKEQLHLVQLYAKLSFNRQ